MNPLRSCRYDSADSKNNFLGASLTGLDLGAIAKVVVPDQADSLPRVIESAGFRGPVSLSYVIWAVRDWQFH